MPPISAVYVNVYAKPRWWTPHLLRFGGSLVGFLGRFSDRGADLAARLVMRVFVRFGYLITVRR